MSNRLHIASHHIHYTILCASVCISCLYFSEGFECYLIFGYSAVLSVCTVIGVSSTCSVH